jgi:hypothetical protein
VATTHLLLTAGILALSLTAFIPRACDAITLLQTGYSSGLAFELPQGPDYDDLEIDQAGSLFFAMGSFGIKQVTGSFTDWSKAPVRDLALATTGIGYGAGVGPCHCILNLQPDGSYSTLHQDNLSWTNVALSPDDSLYASIWAGPGQGLYLVNRATGEPTLLVSGGPGTGGTGHYRSMRFGNDGKLYALGSDGAGNGHLYRLDGDKFTAVASLPHSGISFTLGPSGLFYVASQYETAFGYQAGDLWIVDPVAGTSSLLARSGSYVGLYHPAFGAVGYDPNSQVLYLAESYKVWAIRRDPTPALSESWGSVKARYRGDPAAHSREGKGDD